MNDMSEAPAARQADAAPTTPRASAGSGTVVLFTAATFLSAMLLFSVQPLFAKMVLPVLGGAPSVWAVALCFFQGALLAGYCYAHGLARLLPATATGFIHLALSASALLVLPVALPDGWTEPPSGDPSLWQLGLFTVAIGLPFVIVAANAPLLQAWFVATGHRQGRDPYFLYAASNLGSLIALLSYPFLLEPLFGVSALSRVWTGGFVALLLALGLCFWRVRRAEVSGAAPDVRLSSDRAAPVSWSDRAAWVGLAFVPSALLTAFTNHVTTDVASAPLLWVGPLSLYLLTFVLVFRERAIIPTRLMLVLHLAAVITALLFVAQTKWDKWFESSLVGVLAFVTSAMVAHRTLYEARPAASRLTEFYLLMATGGVLGGLFAALIAPRLFSEIWEYPLLVALSMACRPGALRFRFRDPMEAALVITAALAAAAVLWKGPVVISALGINTETWGMTAFVALALAALLLAAALRPPVQLVFALAMFAAVVLFPSAVHHGEARRSYFGVYRVSQSTDGEFNILTHGTTLHGAQRIRDGAGNRIADVRPGTYYYPESPMAKAVEIVRARLAFEEGRVGRYGVVGLGAGSLACLSKAGEAWRFFEIDPLVVDISARSGYFTYLQNCQPETDIVLGDARLTLAKQRDGAFDLLIVDAFTSDAIPVHLMTAEAVRLYLAKLTDAGVLVLHVSNRYLDLERVLAGMIDVIPDAHGLVVSDDTAAGTYAETTSTVVVFSRSAEALDPFRALAGARDLERGALRPWTDDYSDILGPFLSKIRNR